MAIKNAFLTNLLKLTSSSVMAQLILIISSPILTRLYTPEDFGLFALFLSIVTILATLANLRYDQAIIIPQDEDKAKQLVYLCLYVNILIFFLIFIFLCLFSEPIFNFFNIGGLKDFSWVIALAVFFIGVFQAFNYWLLRNKNFNIIAKIKIQQSAIIVGFQLVFFKFGALCLLLGHTLGQIFGVLRNGYNFLKNNRVNHMKMKEVCYEFIKFPKYSVWSALLNNVGAQLPVFLFTVYFSPAMAGLYLLTQRVIKGPLTIVSQAVTQIFLSNLRNENDIIVDKLLKINSFLTTIVIVPLAVVLVAGEHIFAMVFGSNWKEAGTVAGILAPWIFMVFICSPISSLLEYRGMQKSFLVFQICLLVFRCLSIAIGIYLFDNYTYTLLLFSLVSTLAWMFFLAFVMKVYAVKFQTWIFPLLKKILIVGLFFIPLFFLKNIETYIFYILVCFFSVASFLLIFKKRDFKDEN